MVTNSQETYDRQREMQEVEKAEEKKTGGTLQRLVKVFSVIGFIVVIIVLVLIKLSKPDFPLGTVFIIGGVAGLFFAITFFAFALRKFFGGGKDDVKVGGKKTITVAQAFEIAEQALKSKKYADYIAEVIDEGVEEHGLGATKSKIYFLYAKGKYTGNRYFVTINMHFPDENRRIMINPTQYAIHKAKQMLATNPEEEPDTEVVERRNPLLGTEEKITRTTKTKKEKEAEANKPDLQ